MGKTLNEEEFHLPRPQGPGQGDALRIGDDVVAAAVQQDDLGLSAALESEAFYIGALGSQRSAAARNRRLASLGYNQTQIERIHGPVGLDIGSKRPAEIAVSILAEITALRNGVRDNAN